MKERMSGIWDRVREKEALAAAGRALCAEPRGFLRAPKLWISAACGLAMTLAPVAGAARAISCLL
ncbi:MAG: hypothetical protein FWE77_04370 [Clostridia bacterium]|nr:hypothetical protein [Clostridia bacterium]